MSKTITIDEFLERNSDIMIDEYVAYDPEWGWLTFKEKPTFMTPAIGWSAGLCLEDMFNIAPYQGDWKESLRRVK